jgi:Ca-activated chloride channel homolog
MKNLFDKTPGYLIASCLALLLLWHTSAGTHGQSQTPATPSTARQSASSEPLALTVTVNDKKGDPIQGLPQSAFTVFDDNAPQDIIAFKHEDVPVSIGIVIDFANALEEYRKHLRVIAASLQSFIQKSNSSNDYFILGFNQGNRELLQDWTSNQESLRVVLEQIQQNKLRLRMSRNLYDDINYSVGKLETGRHAKRVLLLISFGDEHWSQISQDELYQRLKKSTLMIYALDMSGMVIHESLSAQGTGSSRLLLGFETLAARQNLNDVTSITGGRMFSKLDPVEIGKALERMALELRSQYSLAIKPASDKGRERWHNLKVRVKASSNQQGERKSISVRSREGYYAGSGNP